MWSGVFVGLSWIGQSQMEIDYADIPILMGIPRLHPPCIIPAARKTHRHMNQQHV